MQIHAVSSSRQGRSAGRTRARLLAIATVACLGIGGAGLVATANASDAWNVPATSFSANGNVAFSDPCNGDYGYGASCEDTSTAPYQYRNWTLSYNYNNSGTTVDVLGVVIDQYYTVVNSVFTAGPYANGSGMFTSLPASYQPSNDAVAWYDNFCYSECGTRLLYGEEDGSSFRGLVAPTSQTLESWKGTVATALGGAPGGAVESDPADAKTVLDDGKTQAVMFPAGDGTVLAVVDDGVGYAAYSAGAKSFSGAIITGAQEGARRVVGVAPEGATSATVMSATGRATAVKLSPDRVYSAAVPDGESRLEWTAADGAVHAMTLLANTATTTAITSR
jgi:hypothetical protein